MKPLFDPSLISLSKAQIAVMSILLHGFPVTSVPCADEPPFTYWRMVCEYISHPRISTLHVLHRRGFIGFTQESAEERRYYLTSTGEAAIRAAEKTA